MIVTYDIYKRNSSGLRTSLIQDYKSLNLVLNYRKLSKFTIKGNCFSGYCPLRTGDGIVIFRNAEQIFAGIVTKLEMQCSDVASNTIEWNATGEEDSIIFDWRIIIPDNDQTKLADVTFASDVYDKIEGNAYPRMVHYIKNCFSNNIAINKDTGRGIKGASFPSTSATTSKTKLGIMNDGTKETSEDKELSAYKQKKLSDVLKEIGDTWNLYPKFEWDAVKGTKTFSIPTQRDKTNSIIISPQFGNVSKWSVSRSFPKYNAVWVCSGDYTETKKKTIVLDANGKVISETIEDVEEEESNNTNSTNSAQSTSLNFSPIGTLPRSLGDVVSPMADDSPEGGGSGGPNEGGSGTEDSEGSGGPNSGDNTGDDSGDNSGNTGGNSGGSTGGSTNTGGDSGNSGGSDSGHHIDIGSIEPKTTTQEITLKYGTRLWVYAEDPASIKRFGRIEAVVSKSDIKISKDDEDTEEDETLTIEDVIELLKEEAINALKENSAKEKYTITMAENENLQFMKDWKCGDKVTVVIDNTKFTSTIETVEVTFGELTETLRTTVGQIEEGMFGEVFQMISGIDKRLQSEESK